MKDFIPDIGAEICLRMKMMNQQAQKQTVYGSQAMAGSCFILLKEVTGA